MKNKILQLPTNTENKEWLSLDDYVSNSESTIIYVRVHGETLGGILPGDLAVVDCDKKPLSSDIVLTETGGIYTLKNFREIEAYKNPLRLVAKNGNPLETKSNNASVITVGIVTHIVRKAGGGK